MTLARVRIHLLFLWPAAVIQRGIEKVKEAGVNRMNIEMYVRAK
jgi:hypothetical protein